MCRRLYAVGMRKFEFKDRGVGENPCQLCAFWLKDDCLGLDCTRAEDGGRRDGYFVEMPEDEIES